MCRCRLDLVGWVPITGALKSMKWSLILVRTKRGGEGKLVCVHACVRVCVCACVCVGCEF